MRSIRQSTTPAAWHVLYTACSPMHVTQVHNTISRAHLLALLVRGSVLHAHPPQLGKEGDGCDFLIQLLPRPLLLLHHCNGCGAVILPDLCHRACAQQSRSWKLLRTGLVAVCVCVSRECTHPGCRARAVLHWGTAGCVQLRTRASTRCLKHHAKL